MKIFVTTAPCTGVGAMIGEVPHSQRPRGATIEEIMPRQQERINHEVATGRLTLGEAIRLQDKLRSKSLRRRARARRVRSGVRKRS